MSFVEAVEWPERLPRAAVAEFPGTVIIHHRKLDPLAFAVELHLHDLSVFHRVFEQVAETALQRVAPYGEMYRVRPRLA